MPIECTCGRVTIALDSAAVSAGWWRQIDELVKRLANLTRATIVVKAPDRDVMLCGLHRAFCPVMRKEPAHGTD